MFDLNILCVGQKHPDRTVLGNKNIYLEVLNSNYRSKNKFSSQIAPIMNYLDGIWYMLRCSKDEIGGTRICDYIRSAPVHPYWIESEEIKADQGALVIVPEYYESLKAIVEYLVTKSPIETIIFFCRFQSNEQETFCGTLKPSELFDLLNQKKILTNVCYVVGNRHIQMSFDSANAIHLKLTESGELRKKAYLEKQKNKLNETNSSYNTAITVDSETDAVINSDGDNDSNINTDNN